MRSEGTGVPVCDGVSAADDMREKPGFIIGGEFDPLAGKMDEKPDGAGLCELTCVCNCGAGSIMKPVDSSD